MGEMRKIPVLRNADHKHIIGWLYLDDSISDEEVANCGISWALQLPTRGLFEATLIPKPVLKIENDPPSLFNNCAYCGKSTGLTGREAQCAFPQIHRRDDGVSIQPT